MVSGSTAPGFAFASMLYGKKDETGRQSILGKPFLKQQILLIKLQAGKTISLFHLPFLDPT